MSRLVDCRHCCRHFLSLSPDCLPILIERSHHKSTAATSIMLRTHTWTNIRSWWPWKRPCRSTQSTRHTWQAKLRRLCDGYFCPSLPFRISPHKASCHPSRQRARRAAFNLAASVCGFRRPFSWSVLWRRRRRGRRRRCGHFLWSDACCCPSVVERSKFRGLSHFAQDFLKRWQKRSWQSSDCGNNEEQHKSPQAGPEIVRNLYDLPFLTFSLASSSPIFASLRALICRIFFLHCDWLSAYVSDSSTPSRPFPPPCTRGGSVLSTADAELGNVGKTPCVTLWFLAVQDK